LALELRERASGTQCDASFFRLARALSGRCSWASLGVLFLFESNLSEKGHRVDPGIFLRTSSDAPRSGILTPSSILPIEQTFAMRRECHSMVSGCIDRGIALPSHVRKRFARRFDNAQFTQPSPAEVLEQVVGGCPAGENFTLPPFPLNTFLSSLLLYVDKRILESRELHLYQFGPRALM
jgi:hypothetical protein